MSAKDVVSKLAINIAGLTFIVSGIAKAYDTAYFVSVLSSYGLSEFYFIAPVVTLIECALGLILIFRIHPRITSDFGIFLTALFTIIYFYGYIFHGVYDCGCFGHIKILNDKPIFFYIKNTVIILLLILGRRVKAKQIDNTFIITTIATMSVVGFMSGKSFKRFAPTDEFEPVVQSSTKLPNFVKIDRDSTYLVFVFSYSCPHCLNSIANLKEYEDYGIVDKVIALGLGNEHQKKIFVDVFKPNFEIIDCGEELFSLTDEFPKAYYIKNDTIQMELSGELPCPLVLEANM